jgi:hypothetical protein
VALSLIRRSGFAARLGAHAMVADREAALAETWGTVPPTATPT